MKPSYRSKYLLAASSGILVGYCLRWFLAAWGWTPIIVLTVFGVGGFLAGYMRAWVTHADETARARRERDEIAARIAQLLDGGVYKPMAAHPSFRSKLSSVPKQAER